jgi:hypothetical protein
MAAAVAAKPAASQVIPERQMNGRFRFGSARIVQHGVVVPDSTAIGGDPDHGHVYA